MARYWMEFDLSGVTQPPAGVRLGCGVTAASRESALALVVARVFDGHAPPLQHLVENVDVRELDRGHVRPNMGNPAALGIWFPLGYD